MHIGLQDWASEIDMRKLTLAEITLLGTYTYTMADLRATVARWTAACSATCRGSSAAPLADGAAGLPDLHRAAPRRPRSCCTTGTAAHGLRLVQRLLPAPALARVLITGAGPVGLGGLIALRDAGFTDITIADPREARQQLALSLSASAVLPVGELSQRFDLVLECSGQHAARDQAMHIVAPRGVVLWVGENDDPWLVQETKAVRRKDFFLVRSFYFPKAEHELNIGLLRRHAASYRRLVDQVFDVDELPAEFARFVRGERIKPLMKA
jgi:threonine dehydrogenase-like Zn-dependent dehydrogenase